MKKQILSSVAGFAFIFLMAFSLDHQSAYADCETGGAPQLHCPYWNVTISWTFVGPKISCSTGGQFTCSAKPPKGGAGNQ